MRNLAVTAAQVQIHSPQRCHARDVFEDQPEPLTIGGVEQDAILTDSDYEAVAQFSTGRHIFINIRLAIGDSYPADRRVARCSPDALARVEPPIRLSIPDLPLPRPGLFRLLRIPGGANEVLLVGQSQDRDRRATPARIRYGRLGSTHRQDRVEEKALQPRLRDTNRPQPGYRLLAMGVGRKRSVLDEEVSTGSAKFSHDQPAVTGLNRIRDDLAFVEEVVGGIDIVLACEQLGDQFARLPGQRLRKRHDPLPPGAMAHSDSIEVCASPVPWRGLVN